MPKSRAFKWLLIGFLGFPLLCCSGIITSCSARWPAKPTEMRRTVTDARGQSHTLRIWEANRIIKLPFFDGPSAYVEFDGKKYKIHSGGFGFGVGGIYVSPDANQIVVARAFEGGQTSGLLIDLSARSVKERDLLTNRPALPGWQELSWRTALEPLTRTELHTYLSCGDHATVVAASKELQARGFEMSDWLAMAKVFADPGQPVRIRRMLGFSLVYQREKQMDRWRREAHFGSTTMPGVPEGSPDFDYGPIDLDWPSEIVLLVASALNADDSEVAATSARALAAMLPDAPDRRKARNTTDENTYVEPYRRWWADRVRGGLTTAPSTAPAGNGAPKP